MEFSTGRLEGSARIQDRPFGESSQEQKRRAPRRPREDGEPAEPDGLAEECENHQLDDIA
jgi:hypothetical protein